MEDRTEFFVGCALVALGIVLAALAYGCSTPRPAVQARSSAMSEPEARAVHISALCPWTFRLCMMYPQACLTKNVKKPIPLGGSGVIVGRHRILTADHVLCDGGRYSVTELDGTRHQAARIARVPNRDIAMLTVMQALPRFPLLRFAKPSPGDVVCSQTAAPERGRKCGEVTEVSSTPGNADISHASHVVPGNSGSGTYDLQGRLAGITVQLEWCDRVGGKICGGHSSSVYDLLEELGL